MSDKVPTLATLRSDIDAIDLSIIQLLSQRKKLVESIALLKTDEQSVRAYGRLLHVLSTRKQWALAHDLDGDVIAKVFDTLTHYFMRLQQVALAERLSANANIKVDIPLVYPCSGASSAGQLAHDLALALDQEGVAQMACLASLGADNQLGQEATQAGSQVIVIDGCDRQCAKRCLQQQSMYADWHFILTETGAVNRPHCAYSGEESLRARSIVLTTLGQMPGTERVPSLFAEMAPV